MRILLVSENRCRDNLVPYPLGISLVAGSALRAGHEVLGVDLMFEEEPVRAVVSAIEEFDPQLVGLSVRNVDNQDMWRSVFYLEDLRELVMALKGATGAPIVLGGAGFSIFPREILEYLDLCLGVVGEGEDTFIKLVDCLESGGNPAGLPGVAFRDERWTMVNPPADPLSPAMYPRPARDVFPAGAYRWKPGSGEGTPFVSNLQSRRGCPMRCIYCTNPTIEGRSIRLRPIPEVVGEMEELREKGVDFAVFTDSLFNHPLDYAKELCKEITRREPGLRWWCTVNPRFGDEELLEMMVRAGCVGISLGNESGSDEMLERLGKDFAVKDVERMVSAAMRSGLRVNCFLLLGGPGEDRSTVEESVDLMDRLNPHQVTVTVGIRVYPGSRLEELALERGFVKKGQNLLYPAFYLEKGLEDWLRPYVEEVCGQRTGWLL
ncbi:MAG: radical SAM protein [Candidatus Geothermincolales bacterium]